ncbi:MAG TPA: hypothetical protein DEG71_07325 [Clostridiales bacterium]|nr:hypothetical protein [Clostridiales bacterium]
MNPENLTQILSAIKEGWAFLYEIAVKQVNYLVISNMLWLLFFTIFFILAGNLVIKTIKYDDKCFYDNEGYIEKYDWLKNDGVWVLWVLVMFAIIFIIISTVCGDYIINYLVNPEYLIYKKVLEMLPVIGQ